MIIYDNGFRGAIYIFSIVQLNQFDRRPTAEVGGAFFDCSSVASVPPMAMPGRGVIVGRCDAAVISRRERDISLKSTGSRKLTILQAFLLRAVFADRRRRGPRKMRLRL